MGLPAGLSCAYAATSQVLEGSESLASGSVVMSFAAGRCALARLEVRGLARGRVSVGGGSGAAAEIIGMRSVSVRRGVGALAVPSELVVAAVAAPPACSMLSGIMRAVFGDRAELQVVVGAEQRSPVHGLGLCVGAVVAAAMSSREDENVAACGKFTHQKKKSKLQREARAGNKAAIAELDRMKSLMVENPGYTKISNKVDADILDEDGRKDIVTPKVLDAYVALNYVLCFSRVLPTSFFYSLSSETVEKNIVPT